MHLKERARDHVCLVCLRRKRECFEFEAQSGASLMSLSGDPVACYEGMLSKRMLSFGTGCCCFFRSKKKFHLISYLPTCLI